MEYVYAAMLLHKAGQKVDEAGVTKVLEAAGLKVEPGRVKALVSALKGVDIEKTVSEAPAQSSPAPQPEQKGVAEEKKEEKKVEEKKSEEEAAAGLGALFG